MKLMLHHSFVNFLDLQTLNTVKELSYAFTYNVYCCDHSHPQDSIDVRDEKVRRKEQHSEKEKSSETDLKLLFKHDDADVN